LNKKANTVFVITGPTAVGKTKLCIDIAHKINAEIISADSRQFYKELTIGTAKPTLDEQNGIPHHLIDFISIKEEFNVNDFEKEALKIINQLFSQNKNVIVTGGSGLYIDILCHGFDDEIPDANPEIRNYLNALYQDQGIVALQEKYKNIDPQGYQAIDINNYKRLFRAIEISLITGKPASQLKKGKRQKRPFNIVKIGLNRDRQELYNRINVRVDHMIKSGLVEEAKKVRPYKNHNALKTVGYRELFDYFDNKYTLAEAIEKIKTNSRRYAKRQITWFKKDEEIHWFHPDNEQQIVSFVSQFL
jgi:tRNA dimethylallyltransferase